MSLRIIHFTRFSYKPFTSKFLTNSLIRTYARGRPTHHVPDEDPRSLEEKKKAFREQFDNILHNQGKHIPIDYGSDKSTFWHRNKWAQPYFNTVYVSFWVGLVLLGVTVSLWIEEWWQNRSKKKKEEKENEDDDDDGW